MRRAVRPGPQVRFVVASIMMSAVQATSCGTPAERVLWTPGAGDAIPALCQVRGADPIQQTALGPSDRSHWLQPWRASVDTWPAQRMRSAVGIGVERDASDAPADARMLAEAGFRRAVVETSWGHVEYDDPTRLGAGSRDQLRAWLGAFKGQGIRPLIMLNSHDGSPCPMRVLDLRLVEASPKGSRQVKIDRQQIADVVPGRTGFSGLTSNRAADTLITAVDAVGVASLSRPLAMDLSAGPHKAATLRFEPFGSPSDGSGRPSPQFEDSVRGWLDYAKAVAREAREVLGGDAFDLEVWNELGGGDSFLDVNRYYDPPLVDAPGDDIPPATTRAILSRTVQMLRDPASGVPAVGIGDGFANKRWSDAGSTEVAGVTALDRHVTVHGFRFPRDAAMVGDARPLDAKGRPDGRQQTPGTWSDGFTPTYDAVFPELPLTAIQPMHRPRPGQLVRDLSPFATRDQAGNLHGRDTHPPGAPPPAVWITALNLNPSWAKTNGASLSRADIFHLQAKSALRSLAAYVGEGASAVFFYAPEGGDLSLRDPADMTGGEPMRALRRFTAAFAGPPGGPSTPRSVSLVSIGGCAGGRQFDGDGTTAHPALHNRDVLGFFPFQIDDRRFVIAVYVMTRNLATRYGGAADDVRRLDLPPEQYQLTMEGVDGSAALVEASDPLTGAASDVAVIARQPRLVVNMAVTDAPRLLTITEP